jgi:hypothetical protein
MLDTSDDEYAGVYVGGVFPIIGLIELVTGLTPQNQLVPGQPTGITVDANGYVYVANQLANSISKYSIQPDGSSNLVAVIAGPQTGLSEPTEIAIDTNGCLYVANGGNPSALSPIGTIIVYDSTILSNANSNSNAPVYNLTPIATISNLSVSVSSQWIIGLTLANPPRSTSITIIPPALTLGKAGNTITLTWSPILGKVYQVQCTTNLIQGNWQNRGVSVTATNSIMNWSDIIGPDPQRFYRLLVQ